MKTLNTIQKLSKIGKIISRIIFVFCTVGFIGCAAGILGLRFGGDAFKVGGVTVHSIIENSAEMTMPAMYAFTASGAVLCAAEAVLCRFAVRYFNNELADGTPFTLRGAKELMRLGVLTIAIPLAAVIACSVGAGIAAEIYPEIGELSFDGFTSAGLGVMMIVTGLICRYGAETVDAGRETEQ